VSRRSSGLQKKAGASHTHSLASPPVFQALRRSCMSRLLRGCIVGEGRRSRRPGGGRQPLCPPIPPKCLYLVVPDRRTPMPRLYHVAYAIPTFSRNGTPSAPSAMPASSYRRTRARESCSSSRSTVHTTTPDASPNSRAPNRSAGHPQSVRACVRQTCVRMRGLVPGPQLTTFHVSSAHKHLATLVSRTQNLAISATGMRTSSSCRCS
jgi:hypothetical protein